MEKLCVLKGKVVRSEEEGVCVCVVRVKSFKYLNSFT